MHSSKINLTDLSSHHQAKGIHVMRSISSMIFTCRPTDKQTKHLALMAKFLEDLFYVSFL